MFFSESPYQKTVPAKISVYLDLSLLIDRVLKREKGRKIGFFQKGPIFAENGPNSSIFNQIKHFKNGILYHQRHQTGSYIKKNINIKKKY